MENTSPVLFEIFIISPNPDSLFCLRVKAVVVPVLTTSKSFAIIFPSKVIFLSYVSLTINLLLFPFATLSALILLIL